MGFFNWAAPVFGHFADRWDSTGIARIADWLRPFVPAKGALLDVGGGTGALARRLSTALDCDVTVLDPTPQMLAYVTADARITSRLGSAEAMPLEDDAFDALIVTDAFHHFRDQPGAVREFARVVKPGGGVVVLDLDPRGILMGAIVLGERILGEPGAFFTPDGMCAFMAENGITGVCERLKGPGYVYRGKVLP